tara:strand:- start:206 stop:367 length:162 start_codon:yes stop_codon:yes gene_type:complete
VPRAQRFSEDLKMPTSAQESVSATFAQVEQTGMKLAIKGRIVAIVLMGIWLIA